MTGPRVVQATFAGMAMTWRRPAPAPLIRWPEVLTSGQPSPVRAAGGPLDPFEDALDDRWQRFQQLPSLAAPVEALPIAEARRRAALRQVFEPRIRREREALAERALIRSRLTPRQAALDAAMATLEAAVWDALEAAWIESLEPTP